MPSSFSHPRSALWDLLVKSNASFTFTCLPTGLLSWPLFSAVFGILAAVDIPIVYMANRWWRTQHPAPVIAGGAGSGLDARMALTLCITLAAFTLLYFYLWRMRCELERAGDVIETLQRQLQQQGLEVR